MKMQKKIYLLFALSLFATIGCAGISPEQDGTTPPSHQAFDKMLKQYVDDAGQVNYKGFLKDSVALNNYLRMLENNAPNKKNWSKNDELAYWINAYNAYTIKLIIKYYPVESIKDIGSKIQIPFVNTPWDIEFISIGGENLSLNNIEHNILRKNYEEPRIHFAIVCASFSCPQLRNEAFEGKILEQQLTEQARQFLADNTKNKITSDRVEISKIFSWFKGDFTKNGSLVDYLNLYAPITIDKKAKVSHMNYDWSLNEQ